MIHHREYPSGTLTDGNDEIHMEDRLDFTIIASGKVVDIEAQYVESLKDSD
jgi:hypothetical protein